MTDTGPDPQTPPPPPPPAGPAESPRPSDSDRTLATIVYVLYLVGLVNGITAIIGVVLALVRKEEAEPWLQNHYTFQIFTFLYALAFFVVGLLTVWVLGLGLLVWLAGWVWFVVRSIVGLVRIIDNKPNPDPRGFWI